MDVRSQIRPLEPLIPDRPTEPRQAHVETRRLTIVAVAVAATTPLIAYVGNLGLAPLAALAGLACLVDIGAPRRWPAGVWALIALLVWALASYAWSPLRPTLPALMRKPDAVTGLKLALELLLYGAFVAGMARIGPRGGAGALASLTVTLAVVLLLLAVEAGSGMAVFRAMRDLIGAPLREYFLIHRVARCCYVACVLMWPLGAWLLITGRRLVACALWLAVLGTSIVLRVDSPVIALVLASAAAASVWTFGRYAALTLAALTVLYLMFAPVFVTAAAPLAELGKASWEARIHIWRFAVGEMAHKPVFGWGLDASRFWADRIPLHPHDAAIQIWLELGVVGIALAAGFSVWFLDRLGRAVLTDRAAAAAGAGSAVAFLAIDALSFGVWQEWWLAVAAIAAGACFWLRAAVRDQAPAASLAAS